MPGTGVIDAETLHGWILDGGELAVLDAREEAEFGEGHIFWSSSCPLSRKELRLGPLLPSRSVRIVCTDDGGGLAEALAGYLAAHGYARVFVLAGGVSAWREKGLVLYTGVNTPAKAFGEWVEHTFHTPSVSADELDALLRSDPNVCLLDCRTAEEFRSGFIPGAANVPGGELAHRAGALINDRTSAIVVNCAGRTRSIIGAESLRRAGFGGPIYALRNGTMGWHLAGHKLSDDPDAARQPGAAGAPAHIRDAVAALAKATGVRTIAAAELAALRRGGATVYLVDVRSREEYERGHFPGALHMAGGQLVMKSDEVFAVRAAQIALFDSDGVRARMAGQWLRQAGYPNVCVVESWTDGAIEHGPKPVLPMDGIPACETVEPQALAGLDAVIVDVSTSLAFRAGHIGGALWGVRTRLSRLKPRLGDAPLVVVAATDEITARLAVAEVRGLCAGKVKVLSGGLAAWRKARLPLEVTPGDPADEECVDVFLKPYERFRGQDAAMQEYLDWEQQLKSQVGRDDTVAFGR